MALKHNCTLTTENGKEFPDWGCTT